MNEIIKKIDEEIEKLGDKVENHIKGNSIAYGVALGLQKAKEIVQAEQKENKSFKQYFMELYGEGLEVANWHLNGDTEPLDNFIDSALECEAEQKEPTYEQLKYGYDLQSGIIKQLEKSNQELSDRVVKAEGLISECEVSQKTKGDVIRESNESLINFLENDIDFQDDGICSLCNKNNNRCCEGLVCKDEIIKYLNQKVEEE